MADMPAGQAADDESDSSIALLARVREGLSVGLLATLVWSAGAPAIAAAQSAPAGAVVEAVVPGSGGARAGILANDIIESWTADGEGATPIRSVFDLMEAEVEQLPRRALTLSGRRGDAALRWRLDAGGISGLMVRPALARHVLDFHESGRRFKGAPDVPAVEAHWAATAQFAARATSARRFASLARSTTGRRWTRRLPSIVRRWRSTSRSGIARAPC
jgi:hypothetical protein